MAVDEPEDRRKLADRMNIERVQRRLGTWDHIAREMGISSALLRAIRNGRGPVTFESEVAIEQFYGWPEGTVRSLLPCPSDEEADEAFRSITNLSVVEYRLRIREIAALLGAPAAAEYKKQGDAMREKARQRT